MRTIIDVDRKTWANVKHFATVGNFTLNNAVQKLLKEALTKFGYRLTGEDTVADPET